MIERGERVRHENMSARVASNVRIRADALRAEFAIGSVDLARVGLVTIGIGLQSVVLMSPGHFRPAGDAFFAVLIALETLASLGICLLASLPLRTFTSVRTRQAIAVLALVILAVLSVFGVQRGVSGARAYVEGKPYNNDGAVMDYYAALQVSRGRNPYVRTNIVPALAALNVPATTTTPLKAGQFRGLTAYPSEEAVQQAFMNDLSHRWHPGIPIPAEFESKYNYPAGSFLFILPFVGIGLHDMRFLYVLFLALIGVYLWFRMPRPFRMFVPLLILADLPLITLTAGGQPDTMYGFFLLLALAEWSSPWLSPVAMGMAVGTKQLAWFFVPLYLVLIAKELGMREVLKRTGIVAGVFLILNGLFIVQSPTSYFASLAGPMTDPMFPLGVGIISLFVSGVVPMLPKIAFGIAEAAAWVGGVGATIRWQVLGPAGVVVFGALPLFFAWRSLVNYFYLVPLIVLAVVLASAQQHQRLRSRT